MKKLVLLLVLCSLAANAQVSKVLKNMRRIQTDTLQANVINAPVSISAILGQPIDTTGISSLRRPVLVNIGNKWVVKNGIRWGADSTKIPYMATVDSVSGIAKTLFAFNNADAIFSGNEVYRKVGVYEETSGDTAYITLDGGGNLVFYDPVTGAKTLAQIVTSGVDSTTWIATDYDVSRRVLKSDSSTGVGYVTATHLSTSIASAVDSTTWLTTDYQVGLRILSSDSATAYVTPLHLKNTVDSASIVLAFLDSTWLTFYGTNGVTPPVNMPRDFVVDSLMFALTGSAGDTVDFDVRYGPDFSSASNGTAVKTTALRAVPSGSFTRGVPDNATVPRYNSLWGRVTKKTGNPKRMTIMLKGRWTLQ